MKCIVVYLTIPHIVAYTYAASEAVYDLTDGLFQA
jgi:hypothetical protein